MFFLPFLLFLGSGESQIHRPGVRLHQQRGEVQHPLHRALRRHDKLQDFPVRRCPSVLLSFPWQKNPNKTTQKNPNPPKPTEMGWDASGLIPFLLRLRPGFLPEHPTKSWMRPAVELGGGRCFAPFGVFILNFLVIPGKNEAEFQKKSLLCF